MGRPKKDKFEDLDEDFKDSVAAMDEAGLRSKISEITLNQEAVLEAKENDQDLASKKEEYKVAGASYREATKANKLRVKFLRQVLGDKNKDTGESGLA
jgi:hypothetical protein